MEAPGAAATGSVCSWDWQKELEVFAGRISRGRADKAAAARRASEEAERLALQRIQDAERRALAWQTEESAALQNFLSGWHHTMDVRLEQVLSQIANVQKRLEQDSAQGLRNATHLEALSSRIDNWEVKFQELRDLKEGQSQIKEDLNAQSLDALAQLSACQSEFKEAFSSLDSRLQEVETRGGAVARGLRALEPFVEQVTARLEPLEPAIEGLRSELSASSQVHRTAIAAEGKRIEEGLGALQEQVTKQQEDGFRIRREIQEAESLVEAVTRHAEELDAGMKEAATNINAQMREMEDAQKVAARQIKQIEAFSIAQVDKLRVSTAKDLQGADEKLRTELRKEFKGAVSEAVSQAKASLAEKLQRQTELQRELQTELQELQSSSGSSAEMLRSLQKENQKLTDAFERTKGKGISFEWKIPRCLQRLRYLSLLSEPGLWLDSDSFHLGSLGPLEMRLYAKGLRGGDGQCAVALRFPEAHLQSAVPLMVDLMVGDCTKRASQSADPEGLESMVWLAESMGSLDEHLADDSAELMLRTELPLLTAPALLASRAPSSLGSVDDLRTELPKQIHPLSDVVRPSQGATPFSFSDMGRVRDLRGVPSRDLPTLPISDPSQSSGVFSLRGSWAPGKAKPFDELLVQTGQRNLSAVPDDAAR